MAIVLRKMTRKYCMANIQRLACSLPTRIKYVILIKKKKQLQQPGKYQVNFLPFSICQQGEMIIQPDELPLLMKHFYSELESKTNICNLPESNHTPFELACWTHAKFVDLHPFRVGNRRTGRLIMNYQLIRYDYLPLSILQLFRPLFLYW